MRQGVIICEGSTDYALLQYYMRKAFSWTDVKDEKRQKNSIHNKGRKSRLLEKDGRELTIMAAGGSSRIREALGNVLEKNRLTPPDGSGVYDHIVIMTDRDEANTELEMLSALSSTLLGFGIVAETDLTSQKWIKCTGHAQVDLEYSFEILVLIIPVDEEGALETFLLRAVSAQNPYDKDLVDKCEIFVDGADPERRYLTKRGYITKAKFDTFFSVRTTVDQFNERQSLILSVDWENYQKVNEDFSLLADL